MLKQFMTIDQNKPNSSPSTVIKDTFTMYSRIFKEYAKFFQRVQLKDEATTKKEVMDLMNKLNEKHNFGSAMFDEVENHIKEIYSFRPAKVRNSILEGTEAVSIGVVEADMFDNGFKIALNDL